MTALLNNLRRAFAPAALCAALLLLAGSLALPHLLRQLGVVLAKKAVPLRAELDFLAPRFGAYELAGPEAMSPDVEKGIGTPHYISWLFHDRTPNGGSPDAGLRLHVAYYTGTADTVPHVPELCYVASGVTAVSSSDVRLPLEAATITASGADGLLTATTADGTSVHLPARTVPATQFLFKPRGAAAPVAVYYFFIVNGKLYGSKTGVRLQSFDVRDRYSYYCKVEVMAGALARDPRSNAWTFVGADPDTDRARTTVSRFLTAALPELMLLLPDWPAVQAGRYPSPP